MLCLCFWSLYNWNTLEKWNCTQQHKSSMNKKDERKNIPTYVKLDVFSTGYIGPASVLIFFIIATLINKLLMSPVVRMVFLKERMEGNFRLVTIIAMIFYRSYYILQRFKEFWYPKTNTGLNFTLYIVCLFFMSLQRSSFGRFRCICILLLDFAGGVST